MHTMAQLSLHENFLVSFVLIAHRASLFRIRSSSDDSEASEASPAGSGGDVTELIEGTSDADDFLGSIFDRSVENNDFGWNSDDSSLSDDNSSPSDDDSSSDDDSPPPSLYFRVVEWHKVNGDRIPFSDAGDSGSLVFLREGDTIVPLGIHIGVTDAYTNNGLCSVFIGIDRWFVIAKEHDVHLKFLAS